MIPTCDVRVDGQQIHQISSFSYLGSAITSNERSDGDIKKKMQWLRNPLSMSSMLKKEHISMTRRRRKEEIEEDRDEE